MAEDIREGTVVGIEEGKLCLPSTVVGDTSDSKECIRYQEYVGLPSSSPEIVSSFQHHRSSSPKPGSRPRQKSRFPMNRASGGPGMQAIFLGSNQKSCGTGFFLPRLPGDDCLQPNKKPGCSPVLVPSRVVRALNLNVHDLASPLAHQRGTANNMKSTTHNLATNRNGNEVTEAGSLPQCTVFSKQRNSSPEIFLPKEWTY